MNRFLIINPGSTSTKLACYESNQVVQSETIRHSAAELERFSELWQQFAFRLAHCRQFAGRNGKDYSAIVAVGGLFRPLEGGVYRVNQKMLDDAHANLQGTHASNLGCALAYEVAKDYGCPAFVVDPVSVDEFECVAYYSGHPTMKRRSLSHALNIHAAAQRAAHELGRDLATTSFVVGHLGGGISIAAVRGGKIIDVNDAASDGPFSPERTGGLPLQQVVTLCFSGSYSETETRSLVMGKGGLVAYLGTNSTEEVERRITEGDTVAREVYVAMAYQIAKEIGAMSSVLKGEVDAIVLTGGVARSRMLIPWIDERVRFIAPVFLYPGEDEMQALSDAVVRVMQGKEQTKEY